MVISPFEAEKDKITCSYQHKIKGSGIAVPLMIGRESYIHQETLYLLSGENLILLTFI